MYFVKNPNVSAMLYEYDINIYVILLPVIQINNFIYIQQMALI